MKNLDKLRDELAQEHYDKREKLFDVNDFSKEVIAVESYKLGWDQCSAHWKQIVEPLVGYLSHRDPGCFWSDKTDAWICKCGLNKALKQYEENKRE